MTDQSKWLILAYAIFFGGGVLAPLDYKLTPDEHWQLLKHSNATVLITEYPIWRKLSTSAVRATATNFQTVQSPQPPPNSTPPGAHTDYTHTPPINPSLTHTPPTASTHLD